MSNDEHRRGGDDQLHEGLQDELRRIQVQLEGEDAFAVDHALREAAAEAGELLGDEVVDGEKFLEMMRQGRAFPFPLSDGEMFGLAASLSVGLSAPESEHSEAALDARFERLGTIAGWLLEVDRDMFGILEDVALLLAVGRARASALPEERKRGRPRKPERSLDDVAARLSALHRDDEARKCLRQAVSTALGEGVAFEREREPRMPTEREVQQRHAAYRMLREELDTVACGLRVPRLANVLLVLLDERGFDRSRLAEVAQAAGILKRGADKRKNLADQLGATRKQLAYLDENAPARARLARASAWWPSPPNAEIPVS